MDLDADVLVIGTGLSESIASAALAKAGLKVVHIDPNTYYGADEASLTLDELTQWSSGQTGGNHSRFVSVSSLGAPPPRPKSYSVSLSPSVVPAHGPLIDVLIDSGVSRYCAFKLCEKIYICNDETVKSIPTSKEEIFKSRDLSLLDKRRIMRFLTFASGEYENSPEIQGHESKTLTTFLEDVFALSHELSTELALSLALCQSYDENVIVSLQRVRAHLKSFGRYGSSPFLFGHYGGLGELAQGFCRICAVSGGTYILGHACKEFEAKEENDRRTFTLKLENFPHDITARVILASPDFIHSFVAPNEGLIEKAVQACCIAIVDGPITIGSKRDNKHDSDLDIEAQVSPIDSALLVFPPETFKCSLRHSAVHVMINGEETMSCPPGKALIYLFTEIYNTSEVNSPELNAETILLPYFEALETKILGGVSLKESHITFYMKKTRSYSELFLTSLKEKGILVFQDLPENIVSKGNAAAEMGRKKFEDTLAYLGNLSADTQFWPPLPSSWNEDDI